MENPHAPSPWPRRTFWLVAAASLIVILAVSNPSSTEFFEFAERRMAVALESKSGLEYATERLKAAGTSLLIRTNTTRRNWVVCSRFDLDLPFDAGHLSCVGVLGQFVCSE